MWFQSWGGKEREKDRESYRSTIWQKLRLSWSLEGLIHSVQRSGVSCFLYMYDYWYFVWHVCSKKQGLNIQASISFCSKMSVWQLEKDRYRQQERLKAHNTLRFNLITNFCQIIHYLKFLKSIRAVFYSFDQHTSHTTFDLFTHNLIKLWCQTCTFQ